MALQDDYFTHEVIRNGLLALGDEMFDALKRTSKSPIIYETLDFAVGLTDAQANLVTQGNGVTGFLGTLDAAVREVIGKHGDHLQADDIYLTNDPYGGGGTHLSDVTLVKPVFADGHIVAFVACKAHWTEVGGKSAGSFTSDSSEIYQEGIQFPCVQLMRAGELNQSLLDMIAANVRLPDMTLGDLWAGVAAVQVGEKRLRSLLDKYGSATVEAAIVGLLDYGEAMVRAALAQLPHGSYTANDFIDDDGLGHGPFHTQVKVTIGEKFIADFTGSHAQVAGPINTTRTGVTSRIRAVFLAATVPDIPANGGMFRLLEVVCPDATLFTAQRPSPTSIYWETGIFAMDLVMKALAPVMPERIPAGGFASVCGTIISGQHPDSGELYVLVEPLTGGWGAGAGKDGERGQFGPGNGETYNIPVEVAEARYGVRVEQYAFHTHNAGAGRQRGGNGTVLDYRIIGKEAFFTGTYGRDKFLPWGVQGGQSGSGNYAEIRRADGSMERVTKIAQARLSEGDLVRLYTGTGGGWGKPAERPHEQVLQDLKNGYITVAQASEHYGVTGA